MIRETRAITLIEMVAVIVVVGLAIPPLMLTWQNVAYNSGRSATIALATFYAQELMEEIKSKDFEDPDQTPVFGKEPGETGRSDFDDVDDFADYTEDPPPGYAWRVGVVYLDPNISDGGTWQELPSGTSDFKQIKVEVSHQLGDSSLVTMVNKY